MASLTYASAFDGISAVRVAWAPLGWRCAWVSEIDPFCCAVCEHHYPGQANLGDATKIREAQIESQSPIGLLVGGTPCQSFSVAGKRAGLDDPRGVLAFEFLRLAGIARPKWLVWENVPGVLSSDEGKDFGAILGAVAELGYGWAYRILDAQYVRVDGLGRAVPQRRRRVFVVGCLGDWRRAAAVLFERESLCGHSPPRREAGKGVARPTSGSVRSSGPGFARAGDSRGQDSVVATAILSRDAKGSPDNDCTQTLVAHSLRAEGFDASEDGTGRGTPLAVDLQNTRMGGDVAGSLDTTRPSRGGGQAVAIQDGRDIDKEQHCIAFDTTQVTSDKNYSQPKPGDPCHPLAGTAHPPAVAQPLRGNPHNNSDPGMEANMHIQQGMAVRRLTPVECARLQAFPDDYLTQVTWRGKCPPADGPMYRALGNSMAVNVMRWIGRRIDMVEDTTDGAEVQRP